MLKRFSVENFSSFRSRQFFDLTAGKTTVLKNHISEFRDANLLKTGVIYGANASGKSNLIKSLDFAKKAIELGLLNIDTYKKYFRLCKESREKPSSFEFQIEVDNHFYSYGFSASLHNKKITEEWLYLRTKNNAKLIFERANNEILLGEKLLSEKNRFEIYADDMRNQSSQLFLSEIASKELTIPESSSINKVFNWITNKLLIIYPDDKFNGMQSIDTDLINSLKNYLVKFDTGVQNISSIEEDFEKGLKGYPENLKASIENGFSREDVKEAIIQGTNSDYITVCKDDNGDLKIRRLGFIHGKNTQDIFELKDESDGTRRLLDFIPLITRFLQDYTIVIDEFDRSLHPKLTTEFIKLFHSICSNKSQLIVTTHESALLSLDLLRRDEIWFVDKGKDDDSSSLFSLNKFKIRYDSRVEKAYLLGRYGAIPIFEDTKMD